MPGHDVGAIVARVRIEGAAGAAASIRRRGTASCVLRSQPPALKVGTYPIRWRRARWIETRRRSLAHPKLDLHKRRDRRPGTCFTGPAEHDPQLVSDLAEDLHAIAHGM